MTAPVITNLVVDTDAMTLGVWPFKVELKGKPEPRLKVRKLQDLSTGELTVSIEAPVVDGKPIVAVSTMDTIARRVLDGARVYAGNKGGTVRYRRYAATA